MSDQGREVGWRRTGRMGKGVVASTLISGSSSGEHNIRKAVIHIRSSIQRSSSVVRTVHNYS